MPFFFLNGDIFWLWMLFAARIIGGFLSSANMPAVMAYVADITTHEDRGKGMGIVGAAIGLGFIFRSSDRRYFFKSKFKHALFIWPEHHPFLTFFIVLFFLKESLPI